MSSLVMARPKLELHLTSSQRTELQRIIKSPASPQKLVRRAHIVSLAAQGWDNHAIATELSTSKPTVDLWRRRFLDQGLAGLQEAPRPGRPREIDPAKIKVVLEEVVQPPANAKRWSTRSMAKRAQVSKDTVRRLWQANDLKPHRRRTFKVSRAPHFKAKYWDVIGVYLEPPTQSIVLCCDEKSQCQALERTQPGLPLKQGQIQTATHDYDRHGTITLFAALDYLTGKIWAQKAPRHRRQEWLKFLKYLDREVPVHRDIHLILDNYATHKHAKVRQWLRKHPRFHMHFTPTSASWMNLVERFFLDLSQDVTLPGSFSSVEELSDDIWAYLDERNLNPKRYEWKKDGLEILEKINRARTRLGMEPIR